MLRYSTDTDTVIYMDRIGIDSAYGDGADIVLEEAGVDIEQMERNGYVRLEDGRVFAFSRFLFLYFLHSTTEVNSLRGSLRGLIDAINETLDIDGETEEDGQVSLPGH